MRIANGEVRTFGMLVGRQGVCHAQDRTVTYPFVGMIVRNFAGVYPAVVSGHLC